MNAEIFLPHGDRTEMAKVIGRKRDIDGVPIGRKHNNPILDSRIYTIKFADGEQQDLAFNAMAKHLFLQIDEEGNMVRLFKGIVGHRRGKTAVDKADQYWTKDGQRIKKKTTAGWDLEVKWKDGSTSWLPLKEVKETNTIEVAEYAIANRIDSEPAFDW